MKRQILALAASAGAAVALVPAPARADAPAPYRSVGLPFLWPQNSLWDVAASAPDGVWISGAQGAYCVQWMPMTPCNPSSFGNPVVRRWTGSGWKEYPIDGWSGDRVIYSVSTGGGETWIAGGPNDRRYAARFDGTAFRRVALPTSVPAALLEAGPAGVFETELTYAANPPIHRWTGSGWTAQPLPSGFTYAADVQSVVPGEAWAVGLGQRTGDRDVPGVARFDGSAWRTVALPDSLVGTHEAFVKVAPVGPGEIWVAGTSVLAHLKDGVWTVVPRPAGTSGPFTDVDVDASGTPWALVGRTDPWDAVPYRYAGGSWQAVGVPAASKFSVQTVVPGTTTAWAVGAGALGIAAFTTP
ncbi:hypothetical protein [Actinomadura atramentaria]|uniref:hypothetical protein n=1 Tax=Actinomadura atramentaria TaxID=1990 RepID=UPI00035F4087|nr:hypothetical protein [Actinomadura atramentaria]